MSKKIKDIVKLASPDKIPAHLREHSKRLHALAATIEDGVPRTNERDVLTKLCKRSAVEIERLASFYPSPVEGVAWCTRNLFELNLIVRFVLMNSKNVDAWNGQAAGDEMQIIEGLLSLATESTHTQVEILKARLTEIKDVCRRHGINPSKPFRMDNLAKSVGRSKDYEALYKLFSKYVHPSSWLVNYPETNTQDTEFLEIFVIHSQLCGGDTYGRLEEWLKQHRQIH